MAETPKCPQCGSDMALREGYKGKFYGCTKFPGCKGTANYEGEQEKCPKCGSQMLLKNGKNGRFYSCSKYPECKSTKDFKETCPKCNSDMVKRNSANGEFWGCTKYPECKGTRRIGVFGKDGKPAGGGAAPAGNEDTTDYSKSGSGGNETPF
jgi:ssDNA-binding Zn-finger/Zn-ribbon topoisomerase 1